jgi:hypothetical protein
MEYVRGTSTRYDRKFSSGMTVDELKDDVLRTSYGLWTEDGKDKHLASIIEKIPNKRHIRKVVCIGLSEIAMRLDQDQRMQVNSLCLAQHLVVLSLVSYIRQIVSHDVELFAADWNYDAPHKEALSSLGFTVLDASYGKQEHFATIDNNTMLICSGIADHESIIPIISEYARPVAMIYDVYDYLTEEPQGTRPALSPLWSRVKHAGAWFTVPGPPLVGTGASERSLPLYTESAGRMLDDYDIAMNLFEFDAIDLANRFELHPNTDWRPADADEREQRRLFGRNSRLFVRK